MRFGAARYGLELHTLEVRCGPVRYDVVSLGLLRCGVVRFAKAGSGKDPFLYHIKEDTMPRRTRPLSCTGEEWEKARMRALVRDEFACQAHLVGLPRCTETRLRMLQVHHLVQRSEGGTHDLENLLTLCRVCHSRIHPWMIWNLSQRQKELIAEQGDARTLPMAEREL